MSDHVSIIDLERYRGDTFPPQFQIVKSDGSPQNITGYTFKFAVNIDSEPGDETDEVFRVNGVLVDPSNGIFQFEPSAANMDLDPTVDYYYEVEQTDAASKLRTIIRGRLVISQDIIKT